MTAETPRTEPVTNTKHSDPRVAMMYWHERAMDSESHFERLTFERDELRARVAELEAAVRKACQALAVAYDWNLDEIEIDHEMVRTADLQSEFRALLSPSPEYPRVLTDEETRTLDDDLAAAIYGTRQP